MTVNIILLRYMLVVCTISNVTCLIFVQDMELAGSNAPFLVAAEVDKVLQENKNCKIMDLACGTGCVGSEVSPWCAKALHFRC